MFFRPHTPTDGDVLTSPAIERPSEFHLNDPTAAAAAAATATTTPPNTFFCRSLIYGNDHLLWWLGLDDSDPVPTTQVWVDVERIPVSKCCIVADITVPPPMSGFKPLPILSVCGPAWLGAATLSTPSTVSSGSASRRM